MNYEISKNAVADWLHRTDLTPVIPTFITLAESRINRDLRVAEMEVEKSGVVDGEYIDLPTNYRQLKYLIIDGKHINYVSHLQGTVYDDCTDGYIQINNRLKLFARGDKYSLVYYASIPTLSDEIPENWLLSKYPEVYLYATLIESAPYIKDDARVELWATAYQNAVTTLMQQNEKQRFGDAGLVIRGER